MSFSFSFSFLFSFEGHAATVLGDYMYVLGGNDVNKTFGDFWRISLSDIVRYVEKQWEMEEEDNNSIKNHNHGSSGVRDSVGNGNQLGGSSGSGSGSGTGGGVGGHRDYGEESSANNSENKSENKSENSNQFQSVSLSFKLPAWECLSANCSSIGERKLDKII